MLSPRWSHSEWIWQNCYFSFRQRSFIVDMEIYLIKECVLRFHSFHDFIYNNIDRVILEKFSEIINSNLNGRGYVVRHDGNAFCCPFICFEIYSG